MVNRDPDDPTVAQWEREHSAMSRWDRRHVRQAITHGQAVAEPRLAEAAVKEGQVVHNFWQECVAATRVRRWSAIAGAFAIGAAVAQALQHSWAGAEGWAWIGLCALAVPLWSGLWTARLLRGTRANRELAEER